MSDDQRKRIVLVEDEALIAMVERRTLESAGYNVKVVRSGVGAIQLIEEQQRAGDLPDLLLMDIDLGAGIDGTEAAQRILQTVELPIVFLSSHTEPGIVARTERITS